MNIQELLKKPFAELTDDEATAVMKHREEQKRLHREKQRADYEALKTETIQELAPIAEDLCLQLSRFKGKAFTQLGTLYELLQDYSKRHQDGKGIFRLRTMITA